MFCLSHKHSRYQNFHYGTRSPAFVQTIPSVSLASETRDHNRTRSAAGTRFPAGYSEYSAVPWSTAAERAAATRSTPSPSPRSPDSPLSLAEAAIRRHPSPQGVLRGFRGDFGRYRRDGASKAETAGSARARPAWPSNAPPRGPRKSP